MNRTLKYPCLVLDHDDTAVNSTATVHYPAFVAYMKKFHPDVRITLPLQFRAGRDSVLYGYLRNERGGTSRRGSLLV